VSNYILITPARNEEKNIPLTIESTINQTLKPKLWVIVNDNSSDSTPQIVEKYLGNFPWIKLINLKKKYEYWGINYSRVCIKGFEFAQRYSKDVKASSDRPGGSVCLPGKTPKIQR